MAVSLVLRVLAEPLTHHHLVVLLNSYDGSGFGCYEHRTALRADVPEPTPEQERAASDADHEIAIRLNIARTAIARDRRFHDAIEGRKVANQLVSEMSTKMQFHALAPWMPLCDSHLLGDDHPVLEMVGKPFQISSLNREAILDAFAQDNHPNFMPGDFENFYADHYGATAVICAD